MKFLVLTLILFASPVWGAITTNGSPAFDNCAAPCNSIITGNVNSLHAHGVIAVMMLTATLNDTTASVTDDGGSSWDCTLSKNPTTNSTRWRLQICRTFDILKANAVITISLTTSTLASSTTSFYSGAAAIGTTATSEGTGTSASIALTTQDANNYVVAACGAGILGATGFTGSSIAATTGTLRAQLQNNNTVDELTAWVNDNTAASASSVTNADSIDASANWACGAVELRTSAGGGTTRRPVSPISF